MKRNLCPLCRQSMRSWALSVRVSWVTENHRALCVRTAAGFRDQCLHTDREKYDALVAKLQSLPLKSSPLALAIWFEIERIKNLHGGHKPVGRTYLAWVSKWETSNTERRTSNIEVGGAAQPATFNLQPATADEPSALLV